MTGPENTPAGRIIDSCGPGAHVHLPGGYTLCFEYDEHGQAWPIIADDRIVGRTPMQDLAALAPHEALGALPPAVSQQLSGVWRCGMPTSAGRPCRAIVPGPGDPCWHHRTTPEQLRLLDRHEVDR